MKGYFKVPNSIFNLRISASEFRVLTYICRCRNNSIAYPSYATIARNCCITRNTAITIIKYLEMAGIIKVEREDRKSNRYTIPT